MDLQRMKIIEQTEFDSSMYSEWKNLMAALSDRVSPSLEDLLRVVKDPNCHLYAMYEGEQLVGSATLCLYHSPSGRKASVEDVVIASEFRGKGWGRRLMEYLLNEVRQYAPLELNLTSKPHRKAANALYQSLGFQRRDTNCYRMVVSGPIC